MDIEIYDRAHAILSQRRAKAIAENDMRISEVTSKIPEIKEINSALFNTGRELIRIISAGKNSDIESEIEKMRLDRMRMEGILPKDPDLIRLMADEPERVFKIRFSKDGTPDARALTASDEEFELLMEHAMMVASHIAVDIENGETKIEPVVSDKTDACAYCEYKGICMLDKYIPGARAKKIKKLTFQEMCERIRQKKNAQVVENEQ